MRLLDTIDQGSINKLALTFKLAFGLAVGLISGWSPMVHALLAMIVLDFVTGVIKAIILGQWTSEQGRKGIGQKALMCLGVTACHVADKYLGTDALGPVVAGFYTITEFGSIIENLAACGVPVPSAVRQAMSKLQEVAK